MNNSLFLQELVQTDFEIKNLLDFLRSAHNTKRIVGDITTKGSELRKKEFGESEFEIKIITNLILYVDKYVCEEHKGGSSSNTVPKDSVFEIYLFHFDETKKMEIVQQVKDIVENRSVDEARQLVKSIPTAIAQTTPGRWIRSPYTTIDDRI